MKNSTFCICFCFLLSCCEFLEEDLNQYDPNNIKPTEEKVDMEISPENSFECIFSNNEIYPEPTLGIKVFMEKLKSNIKYPDNSCFEGKVYLGFKVTSTGKIEAINVFRGLNSTFDTAAILAFKKTSDQIKWNPGTYSGIPVSFTMIIPIRFGNL